MRIEHVAMWVRDLEGARSFYVDVLGGSAGEKYRNPKTGFESIFVGFEGGVKLELMSREDVGPAERSVEREGLCHLALALGSEAGVDGWTERLRARGVVVVSAPRWTGDGKYESVVLDPEGNRLELTR
jgi:lactoylglutathione lyase